MSTYQIAADRAGTTPPCPPLRKGGKVARHAARFEAILPDRSGAVRVLIALAAFALITPVVLADDPATPDSPLVKLLKSKRVPETRLGAIVDMIGKRGTAGDLDFIFQQATASDGFPTPHQSQGPRSPRRSRLKPQPSTGERSRRVGCVDWSQANPNWSRTSKRRSCVWLASGNSIPPRSR